MNDHITFNISSAGAIILADHLAPDAGLTKQILSAVGKATKLSLFGKRSELAEAARLIRRFMNSGATFHEETYKDVLAEIEYLESD